MPNQTSPPGLTSADRPDFVVETHSVDFIPMSARHGRASGLFPMWFGANCMVVTISTGALAVVAGFSLAWAAVALVVGLVVGGLFMAYHSAQGPKLGLPQMIQSRAQFGFYGANLPLIIVVLMYVGFFASGGVLGGMAVAALLHVSVSVGIILESIANVLLVLFGYRVIHQFERVMTVIFVVVFALFTVALAVSAPPSTPKPAASGGNFLAGPFLVTVALAAIYLISYAPYVADYSRYLPERTKISTTFSYTYLGVVTAGIWMMVIGAVLQDHYPSLSVIGQLSYVADAWGPAFKVIVLLVAALGIVGINALNIYGAFMSSLTIGTSFVRHWRPTLALRFWFVLPIGVVVTALAFVEKANFLTSYQDFLSFLLYFLVPWTAINLADFYLVRHGDYSVPEMFSPAGRYGRVSSAGMISYIVGCLIQIPFVNVPFYEGPIAKSINGGDISWIIGILVSGACYLALARREHHRAAKSAIQPTAVP